VQVEPITLDGSVVELRPLALSDAPGLVHALRDEEVWRYIPWPQPKTVTEFEAFIEASSGGSELPFTMVLKESGEIVGTTRMLAIQPQHRALEIGGTMISPDHWRTAVNTEGKYLLLRHAFDTMGCQRVQLQTDLRNERSQRAIERLGAVREGVLRKARIMPDGYQRSSVIYSITDDEWPAVKANLEAKLGREA
jgi:RimJ/RimL family protein N-acetyltransferase